MAVTAKKKKQPNHSPLSTIQFSTKGKKDPLSDERKPKFSGAEDAKTMQIDKARLPKPPRRHLHRRHAGKRSHRAK